ncbi:MAG: sigma-70 family RNA polymerase sigma factor [Bryobacteraceae bacterium]|nr:sigma-70 family RNA polymerase sigma factor [Bryobacteraceae bacterium]
MLKRRFGKEELEQRLEQVLAAMMERIRRGWTPESGRITPLVYEAIGACRLGPKREGRTARGEDLEAIRQALAGLSAKEREALTRYYLRGEDPQEIVESLGLRRERFDALIARLKSRVSPRKASKTVAAGSRG